MAEVVLRSTQHLSASDLRATAVFLKALPQRPGEAADPPAAISTRVAERGAKLYEQHCAQCHGEQGEGMRALIPRWRATAPSPCP